MPIVLVGLCALIATSGPVVAGLRPSEDAPQSPAGVVVAGRVVGAPSLIPIADARVALVPLDRDGAAIDSGVRTSETDADGRFEFPAVAPGPYALTVSTVGYIFVRRRLDVGGARPEELVVPLAEGAGTYEETVTVTADAAGEAARSATALTLGPASLQDLRGVATDDPMRAVQALPGVATGDDFQAGFSVRGAPFRHAGLVVDGVPADRLLHTARAHTNTGSIAMIGTDILARATLAVGARAARDGDWLGATLAFDLREGSRDRTALRAAVSGTSTSVVAEGPIGPGRRGSWLVSLRKSYLDWLVRKVEPDFDSTIGFWDGQAKVVFDVSGRQQVQVVAVGGDSDFVERDVSSPNALRRARAGSTLAAVSWRYTLERWLLGQRVFFLGSEFQNVGATGQELARGYTQEIGWRGEVARPTGKWLLEGGGAVDHVRANQVRRAFEATGAGGPSVRDERAASPTARTAAAWAEASRSGARGAVAIGLRGAGRSQVDAGAWSPWIVAERRAGPVTLGAAVSRSAQFPDPLTWLADDEAPRAERAASFDFGVSHALSPTVAWAATAFVRRERDLLRSASDDRLDPATGVRHVAPAFPVATATLAGRVGGVDLVVRRQAASGLTGWFSYTWAHAEARDVGTGERFDADFDQRHTLNVVASQRISYRSLVGLKFRMGSNVPLAGYFESAGGGLRLSTLRNRVRLPVYARLDARATRTFTYARQRLTVFVEVMNVLNRENVGPAAPAVRGSLDVTGFAERLIPRLPSAGLLLEF